MAYASYGMESAGVVKIGASDGKGLKRHDKHFYWESSLSGDGVGSPLGI